MIVVCPVFDEQKHELADTACECGCSVQFEDGEMIVVHSQFCDEIKTPWAVFEM